MDEIRLYQRALSEIEIALLADNQSSLDVVRKNTTFHSDFEDGDLVPEQMSYRIDGGENGDLQVVLNPKKDAVNNSNYVVLSSTVPAIDYHDRCEYTMTPRIATKDHVHIFQWMVYFPEGYLVDIDEIRYGDWNLISQFRTEPCSKYSLGGEEYEPFNERICYNGGIFNEARISHDNPNSYDFLFRAQPDCNKIAYTYPRGEWIKLTYEILWTTEKNGYYNIWANEVWLGGANNVRTLPEGWVEGTCDIDWKIGQYTSWDDTETKSVYYYFDNLEVYIDQDRDDVCPNCRTPILE
jgi:hypothetical protein